MELATAEKHAKALMTAHGVGSLEFAFDGGKRRLGATHFIRIGSTVLPQKITLSRHYVALLPEDEVRDVVLHEIAHALAGAKAGHGPEWLAVARKVGAKAQRCAAPSASPEAAVVATCPCGHIVSKGHRLPQALWIHRGCGKPLTYTKNGSIVTLSQMPVKYRQRHAQAVKMGTFK